MRREHIKPQGGVLPDGYTQLKSLYSSGVSKNNYIETDFNAQNDFVIRGEMSYMEGFGTGTSGAWVCGNMSTGISRQCFVGFFRVDNSKVCIDTVFGTYGSGTRIPDATFDTTRVFSFEASRSIITLNGVSTSRSYSTSSYLYHFIMFRNESYTDSRYNHLKLYWLSISDLNGNLLHYFVPALRDNDSKEGVFDTVTNKFYPATGTLNYELLS